MSTGVNEKAVKAVLLVGPPGSGKSSVGKSLASLLSWEFVDLDNVIESRCGSSVQEIFAERGEPEFRKLESETLRQLSQEQISNLVIATGGGIIATSGNFELMQRIGEVICLTATIDSLTSRLKDDATRPLLQTSANSTTQKDAEKALNIRLSKLLEDRREFYDLPELQVATDGRQPVDIASSIAKQLGLL